MEARAFTGHHQTLLIVHNARDRSKQNGNYYDWKLPPFVYLNVIACDRISQAFPLHNYLLAASNQRLEMGTAWKQPNKCVIFLSSYQ